MTTIAWTPRVGQLWKPKPTKGPSFTQLQPCEIIGDHRHAQLVQIRTTDDKSEWLPCDAFDALYEPALCNSCGTTLTRQLVDEASRGSSDGRIEI